MQVPYAHTAKNWRQLITPAHDSFKKLEKGRRPGMIEYSATTTNNTANDQRDPAVRCLTMQGSTDLINVDDKRDPSADEARELYFGEQVR